MINRKRLAEALKILSENPTKIEQAQARYKNRLAELKAEEAKGIWSSNALREKRERALADRNKTCNLLVDSMKSALSIVKENNDFTAEAIDLNNQKLQNALSMIDRMGSKLTYNDQVNIISQFRGDFSSLRVLEAAFSKAGIKFATETAHNMQKTISSEAVEQMDEVLSFYSYYQTQGQYNFPLEKAWKRSEFLKAAERYGLDLDNVPDPYVLALDMQIDSLSEQEMTISSEDAVQAAKARAEIKAKQYKLAFGKEELQKAKANGEDAAIVFDKIMRGMETPVTQATQR